MKEAGRMNIPCQVLAMFVSMVFASSSLGQVAPGDLLIYYSFPSTINGAATIDQAAAEFAPYDIVIIGDGLQDGPGDPNPHDDHANTVQIINHPATDGTLFFGYIDLGVSTDNHSMAEIQRRVDAWQGMGIDGIFLDDFGYDYGTTRVRQNAAVDYVHSKGLPVCANGWVPADMFGDEVHANNPTGLATHLGADDYFLSESHQIEVGVISTESDWQIKANALRVHQRELSFKILSNTTPDSGTGAYNENLFHYAWYSAALYNHTATAWGEPNYSASDSLAPYRARPDVSLGSLFKSGVGKNGSYYYRLTERGTIYVNAASHTFGLVVAPDQDLDGVADDFDICPDTPAGLQILPNGSPIGDLDCNCIIDLKDFAIMQVNFSG